MMMKNENSIYYYKPGSFMDFIINIADRSLSVFDALQGFREVKCLPKRFKEMKIEELRQSTKLMGELYNSLRNGMQPPSSASFYSCSMAERGRELIDNISGSYDICVSKAKYKIVKGHYDREGLNFHYVFEIAAAPYNHIDYDHGGNVDFIGAVNDRPSGIDDGCQYFTGSEKNTYCWFDKKKGYTRNASTITEILEKCGFNDYLSPAKQKHPCVFIANLRSPVIDWQGGYGKSRIANLHAFADVIAKATVSIANQMPTFHGSGISYYYSNDTDGYKEEKKSLEDYLIDLLHDRRNAVQQDPSLKIRERWTQSSVWYNLRPILIDDGFEPKESWSKTRQYVQGIINKVCKEQWNVPREALGIIASARAVIYYNGDSYRVHLDAVEELAKLGTDIIFVEKEGIVDVLTTFADKYGIALVNTQGRLTEYGKDLIEAAKKSGAKVSILTDYDAFGIEIAKGARIEIPRIGIDIDNTITFFQQHGFPELTAEDVEEEYEPSISTSTDVEYLKTKRIELDSILAKVGAEALWEYIMHQLTQQTFFLSEDENENQNEEGRDYNRVITKTENRDLYPDVINNFLDYLERLTDSITSDRWTKIKSSLRNVKGELFKLDDKNRQIKEELRAVVAKDEGMKLIVSRFTEMMESGELPHDADE